jgi:peptide/nickel transport system substrate-binding protein
MEGADLPTYSYDPTAGMALLDSLGWTNTDGDGIREAHGSPGVPDGTLLRFTLTTTDSSLRSQISAMIASQLISCGMDVSVVQAPGRDLFAQNAEAVLAGRRFDLAELSSPMSVEALCSLARTEEISSDANGWTGSNLGGYSNPALDEACSVVQVSLPGTEEYTISRQTALRIFSEDLPVLPIFPHVRFTMTRPDLTNVTTGFGQASELQNIEGFRLEP